MLCSSDCYSNNGSFRLLLKNFIANALACKAGLNLNVCIEFTSDEFLLM